MKMTPIMRKGSIILSDLIAYRRSLFTKEHPMKVVQCWDDGVITDGRLIDILRRHGAKATFNLNPGLMDPEKRGGCAWRKQGEGTWNHNFGCGVGKFSLRDIPEIYSGFELASHCWRHENAGSIPDAEWI